MFFTIHRASLIFTVRHVYMVLLATYLPPHILLRKYSGLAVASFATMIPFLQLPTFILIPTSAVSYLCPFFTSYWELSLFNFSYYTVHTYLPNTFHCNFRSIFCSLCVLLISSIATFCWYIALFAYHISVTFCLFRSYPFVPLVPFALRISSNLFDLYLTGLDKVFVQVPVTPFTTVFFWNGVFVPTLYHLACAYSCYIAFHTHIPPRAHSSVVFVIPFCCPTGRHRVSQMGNLFPPNSFLIPFGLPPQSYVWQIRHWGSWHKGILNGKLFTRPKYNSWEVVVPCSGSMACACRDMDWTNYWLSLRMFESHGSRTWRCRSQTAWAIPSFILLMIFFFVQLVALQTRWCIVVLRSKYYVHRE